MLIDQNSPKSDPTRGIEITYHALIYLAHLLQQRGGGIGSLPRYTEPTTIPGTSQLWLLSSQVTTKRKPASSSPLCNHYCYLSCIHPFFPHSYQCRVSPIDPHVRHCFKSARLLTVLSHLRDDSSLYQHKANMILF